MDDVSNKIREYIARDVLHGGRPDRVEIGGFLEDGVIDSFSLQQLLAFLEQEFGVVVDDEHLHPDYFDSVSSISALVTELRGAR